MAAEQGVTTSTAASGQPTHSPSPLAGLTPILVIVAVMYFLVFRPQQKQAKEHRKMVNALKTGDRVLTQGGVFGTVVSLKGNSVFVKIAENVKVEVARSAITQVILESAAIPTPTPTATPEVVG